MMIHGCVAMLDLVHCDTLLVAVDLFYDVHISFTWTSFAVLHFHNAHESQLILFFLLVFVVFLCNVHNVRIDVAHS